jgi:hypothetical protein
VPARKRKTVYPTRPARGAPAANAPARPERPGATSIELTALTGQKGLAIGDQVVINGGGLYAGEAATIERFSGSAIPTAVVRTDSGHTRQVRTIDLGPVPRG